MEPALTLANIPLDLQVTICIFLHPSDILSLRKTCKALELATHKRIVWMTALHRVCLDNSLFLPSFPIPDMSDLELERAAMAPRRWIELCSAFEKQHYNDSSEMLHQRKTTKIFEETANSFFIVPGGRYLVTSGIGVFVWDLGYVSTVDCKLVASAGLGDYFEDCLVQTTPDGKGLVILLSSGDDHLSIFEIYPQSEIPLLTKIAHFDRLPFEYEPASLQVQSLPASDALICCVFHGDKIVFRVVDYRTNYWTCFSADVDVKTISSVKIFVTKTAIVVFCKEAVLIWAIPPLSPQPSDLCEHFLDNNPTHIPPLLKIPFPDGIIRHTEILKWMTVSSWYFGSESIYFDIFYTDSKLQRFKIIIKPDLSDASLHFMNMSEIISYDLMKSLTAYEVCEEYRICEDALVYFWNNNNKTSGTYAGLISAPFTNVVTQRDGYLHSLCPTSGRFVYCIDDDVKGFVNMVVADLY